MYRGRTVNVIEQKEEKGVNPCYVHLCENFRIGELTPAGECGYADEFLDTTGGRHTAVERPGWGSSPFHTRTPRQKEMSFGGAFE